MSIIEFVDLKIEKFSFIFSKKLSFLNWYLKYLSISQRGKYKEVVDGLTFWQNPKAYVNTTGYVRFLMGGFMTDCCIDKYEVAQSNGKYTIAY